MNLRQAAQKALEALETNNKAWKHLADSGDAGFWEAEEQPFYEISVKAITALRVVLAEPEQEPAQTVACISTEQLSKMFHRLEGIDQNQSGYYWKKGWNDALRQAIDYCQTAPTPRKPLTDEEMRECAQAMNAEPLAEGWPELIKFARAIERAHGIGEQT